MTYLVRMRATYPHERTDWHGAGTLLAGVAAILALSMLVGGVVAGIVWAGVRLFSGIVD